MAGGDISEWYNAAEDTLGQGYERTWDLNAQGARIGSRYLDDAFDRRQIQEATWGRQSRADKAEYEERQRSILGGSRDMALAAQKPWMSAGLSALEKFQSRLDSGPGDLESDPGYQFRLAEGEKALQRSASARGGLLSGAAAKEMTRYSQGMASQEYGNMWNRYQQTMGNLFGMAQMGQQATNNTSDIWNRWGYNASNVLQGSEGDYQNRFYNRQNRMAAATDQFGVNQSNLWQSAFGNQSNLTQGYYNTLAEGRYRRGGIQEQITAQGRAEQQAMATAVLGGAMQAAGAASGNPALMAGGTEMSDQGQMNIYDSGYTQNTGGSMMGY